MAEESIPVSRPASPAMTVASLHSQVQTPMHPVPSMREAFTESILESDDEAVCGATSSNSCGPESSNNGAGQRRRRSRPSKHHRLRKLISQIAFGLYLLHDNIARSESTVVRILQTHINEMDDFLSTTTSHFDLASADISVRLQNLRLPLSDELEYDASNSNSGGGGGGGGGGSKGGTTISNVFDAMLESREFRREMMSRNEAVDYVAQRTSTALHASLRDVCEGLAAVDELAKYILTLRNGWRSAPLERVYVAMRHNAEMWFRCCVGLQLKAEKLTTKLNQLKAVIHEIDRRSGVASRKHKPTAIVIPAPLPPASAAGQQRPHTSATNITTTTTARAQVDKPLPSTPVAPQWSMPLRLEPPPRTSSRVPLKINTNIHSHHNNNHSHNHSHSHAHNHGPPPRRKLSKRAKSQILLPSQTPSLIDPSTDKKAKKKGGGGAGGGGGGGAVAGGAGSGGGGGGGAAKQLRRRATGVFRRNRSKSCGDLDGKGKQPIRSYPAGVPTNPTTTTTTTATPTPITKKKRRDTLPTWIGIPGRQKSKRSKSAPMDSKGKGKGKMSTFPGVEVTNLENSGGGGGGGGGRKSCKVM